MKKILESILIKIVRYSPIWRILKPFATAGIVMSNARENYELSQRETPRSGISPIKSLIVQNGPFKGMQYPREDSVGSAIFPKLLGSYEREIHDQIEDLIKNEYSEIIDVGCAEGYYAVGFALRANNTKVFAYDTNENAKKLCREMAELNNVSERIIIKSELTAKALGKFEFSQRGLVICDCEGFEKKLFTKKNLDNLILCDLIIEAHDFIDIEISTYLKKLFKKTHIVESIFSKDDIQKALKYNYPELESIDLKEKRDILAEGRPAIMEWVICKARIFY